MLAQRGYVVTAITGKQSERDYLTGLGASEVIDRVTIDTAAKPLEKELWAGALDSLGGDALAWLNRTMQAQGVIAAFGNALGPDPHTTVLPFILRGARLIGVNANSLMPLRQYIWQRIATDLKPKHLASIAREIRLDGLDATFRNLVEVALEGDFWCLCSDVVDLLFGVSQQSFGKMIGGRCSFVIDTWCDIRRGTSAADALFDALSGCRCQTE